MTVADQLDAAGVQVKYHFARGMCGTEFQLPPGAQIGKHVHTYDHLSALMHGSVTVDVDGMRTTHHAPAMLTIKAHQEHVVTAITPVVWVCLHATDEGDPESVDAALRAGK